MNDREKTLADLSAYLDGELAPPQVRRVEEAARSDPAVAKELAAIRRARDLVRGLPRIRPGDDFVAAVLEKAERLRLVSSGAERAGAGFPVFRWLAAAAVLLVAVGVGIAVAVMLYTAPGPGSGIPGPIAQTPPTPASSVLRGAPKTGDGPGGALALNKDGIEGLSGNEILYAPRVEFETALSDVSGVLASNGIQPAGTARQETDGRKQATILVYADPEQWQQLREGLEQVRNRSQAGAAEGGAGTLGETALAGGRAPAAAPFRGAEPSSRAEGNTGEKASDRAAVQWVTGLGGNQNLNTGQAPRPTTQPANLYNASQVRSNVHLIVLRSGPGPADESAGAGSDARSGGQGGIVAAAATRPATRPASGPATAPATRNAK